MATNAGNAKIIKIKRRKSTFGGAWWRCLDRTATGAQGGGGGGGTTILCFPCAGPVGRNARFSSPLSKSPARTSISKKIEFFVFVFRLAVFFLRFYFPLFFSVVRAPSNVPAVLALHKRPLITKTVIAVRPENFGDIARFRCGLRASVAGADELPEECDRRQTRDTADRVRRIFEGNRKLPVAGAGQFYSVCIFIVETVFFFF